jgi:hypothetical protein
MKVSWDYDIPNMEKYGKIYPNVPHHQPVTFHCVTTSAIPRCVWMITFVCLNVPHHHVPIFDQQPLGSWSHLGKW